MSYTEEHIKIEPSNAELKWIVQLFKNNKTNGKDMRCKEFFESK